jgi:hypothetical protein
MKKAAHCAAFFVTRDARSELELGADVEAVEALA